MPTPALGSESSHPLHPDIGLNTYKHHKPRQVDKLLMLSEQNCDFSGVWHPHSLLSGTCEHCNIMLKHRHHFNKHGQQGHEEIYCLLHPIIVPSNIINLPLLLTLAQFNRPGLPNNINRYFRRKKIRQKCPMVTQAEIYFLTFSMGNMRTKKNKKLRLKLCQAQVQLKLR